MNVSVKMRRAYFSVRAMFKCYLRFVPQPLFMQAREPYE